MDMADQKQKMAIVGSRGLDDERATVTLTIARGAQGAGLDVTLFLVASGVDLVRKGAVDNVQMNPYDPPMKEMLSKFMEDGGDVLVCPPCAKVRGYDENELLDGVTIVGSAALHALIKDGAATLCF
jgi:predicted peroxiredoxin